MGRRISAWIIVFSLILLIVMAGQVAPSVRAQTGGTPIAVGDSLDGTITAQAYQVPYTFTATAGQSVVITAVGQGGLDTYLILQDSSGKSIIEDDDSGGGGNGQIKYTFARAGDYTIIVTRSGGQGGQTTGAYTLTVTVGTASGSGGQAATQPASQATQAAPSQATQQPTKRVAPTLTPRTPRTPTASVSSGDQATPTPSSPQPTRTTRPGQPTLTATPDPFVRGGLIGNNRPGSGTITDTQLYYVFGYDGLKGQQIELTMEGQNGLVPSIDLVLVRTGQAIAEATASSRLNKVIMTIALPEDGQYAVLATRLDQDAGTTSGRFRLTLATTESIADITPVTGAAQDVVSNLQDLVIAPDGGQLLFSLPDAPTSIQSSDSGLVRKAIGPADAKVTNFVANVTFSFGAQGDVSGCGIGFRSASSTHQSVVFVTKDGRVVAIQHDGNQSYLNTTVAGGAITPNKPNTLTVIAVDDQLSIYVNGTLQNVVSGKAEAGAFELNLFNPDGTTATTSCRFSSGWVWSLDGQ